MKSEVNIELNLSCKNSHIGGRAWLKHKGYLEFWGFRGCIIWLLRVVF